MDNDILRRTYRVQRRTNLYVAPWEDARTNIPGPPLINELMILFRTNTHDRVYYRIGVEIP